MAYTLRNVSRESHTPQQNKPLTGEPNKGLGSVKKTVRAQAEAKIKAALDAKAKSEAS